MAISPRLALNLQSNVAILTVSVMRDATRLLSRELDVTVPHVRVDINRVKN